MTALAEIVTRLDEVNRAVAGYDPVLKEAACDILLARAFPLQGSSSKKPDLQPGAPVRSRRRRAKPASFAALLGRWAPTRAREQALLTVYFLTRGADAGGTSTRAVTALLREHGINLAAPTTALLANTARTPALLSATKTGESKQARQTFQITAAGEAFVRGRLGDDE